MSAEALAGSTSTWYGIAPDGSELMIPHSELMEWAFEHELQITVGWSHHLNQNGNRLVRGPKMIATAKAQGWDDLAVKLAEFGFADQEEVKS